MMKKFKKGSIVSSLFLLLFVVLTACKNNDPSVLKIFVRSAGNELIEDAQVVIIGDVNSDPATLPFVDTVATNSSGFALFNMDKYYSEAGKDNTIGYFDVLVKKGNKEAQSYVRCRAHITTVETVFLPY
jgi:hypothetical protein